VIGHGVLGWDSKVLLKGSCNCLREATTAHKYGIFSTTRTTNIAYLLTISKKSSAVSTSAISINIVKSSKKKQQDSDGYLRREEQTKMAITCLVFERWPETKE